MQELRQDPVTGRRVIIAPGRALRPSDFRDPDTRPDFADKSGSCPFCEGSEGLTPPEILALRPPPSPANSPSWLVRVVPNKYPALSPEGDIERKTEGIFESIGGWGTHEVIIESPGHDQTFATMTEGQIGRVFQTFRSRILDLKKDPRLQYILIFKNHGYAAGATLRHPHSQLLAMPVVPSEVSRELQWAESYFKLKEHCLFCDMLQQEVAAGTRMIDRNEDFVALAPYASRFPFEARILPRKHESAFENMPAASLENLARSVKRLMAKLDSALALPASNLVIHTAPLGEAPLDYYHWHIEVMPRLSKIGGFELGSGIYINPMPPEEAARRLRKAVV